MIDNVRPRDSGKSSVLPDHPSPKRRPVSWHRSTSLEQRLTRSARPVCQKSFLSGTPEFLVFNPENRQSFKLVQPLTENNVSSPRCAKRAQRLAQP